MLNGWRDPHNSLLAHRRGSSREGPSGGGGGNVSTWAAGTRMKPAATLSLSPSLRVDRNLEEEDTKQHQSQLEQETRALFLPFLFNRLYKVLF